MKATIANENYLEIGSEQLDLQKAVDFVSADSAGAISTFIGTTRDNFNGKKVLLLEYEGYVPMALKELEKICLLVRQKWPSIVRIAIFHRLGIVRVKASSVIIAISSPHRLDAILAVHFAIDTLKATVPIWKLEQYEGDDRLWKENQEWDGGRIMTPM